MPANFLRKKLSWILTEQRVVWIWFLLALIAACLQLLRNSYNNYLIYEGVFFHTLRQLNLYAAYPAEYVDTNHYGPLFSLVIAPFALLPDKIGVLLWCLANAYVLYRAVTLLPIAREKQHWILLFSAVELMTSTHNVQFNPAITALLILSYVLVQKEQDVWATLLIATGFLVKLYGIAGLAFFCFSRHKVRFAVSFIGWTVVLVFLPALISSPAFVLQSYHDWLEALVAKNQQNNLAETNNMQDISVMGFIKRTLGLAQLDMKAVLLPAVLVFGAAFLRFKQYASSHFRLTVLSSVLMMVVLFSSSSESPTYIIAVTGVGIWWMQQPNPYTRGNLLLILFVLIGTSLSVTDLFPPFVRREFIVRYAFKALPCFIVWLVASQQLLTRNYLKYQMPAL